MRQLYEHYNSQCEAVTDGGEEQSGLWNRLPSYNRSLKYAAGKYTTKKFIWNKNKRISKSLMWLLNVPLCSFPTGGVYLSKIIQAKARLFTRNIRDPGAAFEYVIFANKKEQRCVCIFQAGHLLEGPPGWDNTLLSKLIEVCAFHVVILHSLCHPLSQQLSSKPKVAEINGKK